MSRKKTAFIIFALLDTVFILTCGAAFSIFLYARNNGGFRVYLLCGVIIGMILYHRTVGRLVIFAAEKSIGAVRKAVKLVIVKPVCVILRAVMRLFGFIAAQTVGRLAVLCARRIAVMRTDRAMHRISRDIRFGHSDAKDGKGSAQSEKII